MYFLNTKIMKSLSHRARQFVTSFLKYFNDDFDEAWVAQRNPIDTEPDPKQLVFYADSQRKCDAFLEFYQEHSTSMSAGSQYQCSLLGSSNQHILDKAILHNNYKFNCDCSTPIEKIVSKKTNDPT